MHLEVTKKIVKKSAIFFKQSPILFYFILFFIFEIFSKRPIFKNIYSFEIETEFRNTGERQKRKNNDGKTSLDHMEAAYSINFIVHI